MKYTIEQYENMPFRESTRKKHSNRSWEYSIEKIGNYTIYRITKRVIESNIGKSFDMAFHYFCTLVPKHLQYYFLDEFKPRIRPWQYYWDYYYIDENRNIQQYKKQEVKKSIIINLKPNKYLYLIKDSYHTGKYKWVEEPGRWTEVFNTICIEDNTLYFTSKNDYKYKRLMREKRGKKIKKVKPSIEDFRPLLRAKQLKEREETRIKLEAKGFRKNAFTNNKTDL